jgi:hypothetical protein
MILTCPARRPHRGQRSCRSHRADGIFGTDNGQHLVAEEPVEIITGGDGRLP